MSSSTGTKAPTQVEDGNFRLSIRFLENNPATSSPTNQKKSLHTVENNKDSDLPLKTFMVKQNLWSWFLDVSPPSAPVAGLLNNANFPFQPTLNS